MDKDKVLRGSDEDDEKQKWEKEIICKYEGAHLFMRNELSAAICPYCNTPIYNIG